MAGEASGVVVIAVHPQLGETVSLCKLIAQKGGGAKSYDAFGTACWDVYGMSIKLNPIAHSVMEGAMITNINFNAWAPPAIEEADVPGSNWATSMGYTSA